VATTHERAAPDLARDVGFRGGPVSAGPDSHVLLSLQRSAGNGAVARLLGSTRPLSVQRWKDEKETLKEIAELDAKPVGHDEALRTRANALLGKAENPAEKMRVVELKQKFSKGGTGGVKPVAVPTKLWEWSKEDKESAALLGDLWDRIRSKARQIKAAREETDRLAPDEREDKAKRPPSATNVPLYFYEVGDGSGLGLWAGLIDELRKAKMNSVHRIRFVDLGGQSVTVVLSQHESAYDKSPDYFVHDARAQLVYNSVSKIQQAAASLPHQPKDFEVSYRAFADKLGAMRTELSSKQPVAVTDKEIAAAALLVVRNPTTAHLEIMKTLPAATREHVGLLYELVSTWMLAEPTRHASSMVSGVVELELIRLGKKTFAQALADAPTGSHPMAHVGSESHGRQATQDLPALKAGKQSPASAVVHKQAEEVAALGETEIRRLIDEYLAIAQVAVSSGAMLVPKNAGPVI
jgi:hypothetical protein